MPHVYDEPMVGTTRICETDCAAGQIETEIKSLCRQQPFAVLATQGDGQPYTSLISFAASQNLKHVVFSTTIQTRKFSLLLKNRNVAIMVDNRSCQTDNIHLISGVTITGCARPLKDPAEIAYWSQILTAKHTYLDHFVQSSSSSLILVSTIRFFYVRRFQEVYQWIPEDR